MRYILCTQQDYQTLELMPDVFDIFNAKENRSFSVFPALSLWTEFDETYEVGITYTFELIVHSLSRRGYFDAKNIGVVAYLQTNPAAKQRGAGSLLNTLSYPPVSRRVMRWCIKRVRKGGY